MWFDESRLDDPGALLGVDAWLRTLAGSGARVRRETGDAEPATTAAVQEAGGPVRPRAVIAAGPDSRLLRAVLEPWCPVPFVAWPGPGLPGWAGSLDLVVVLAPEGARDTRSGVHADAGAASSLAEAVRRGCQVVAACAPASWVAEHAAGRYSTVLPAITGDPLAAAVVVLTYFNRVGLGPDTDAEGVAAALDAVAVTCGPGRDLAVNPAKATAIALADALPLVWGGSVLAARAARRVAEQLRRASGRSALADDAEHLLPIVEAARPHDLFDDPFADSGSERRPLLLILDDGSDDPLVVEQRRRLTEAADQRGVRVEVVDGTGAGEGGEIGRYACLVLQGTYASAYLSLGLVDD